MTGGIRPLLALFMRAVRDDVRAKFSPIMRTLSVVFVLFLIWTAHRDYSWSAPGQTLLMMVAWVNLIAATLFGLGTFSSAIAEEKEEGTLPLMIMTRLNPLAILLGKSTARMVNALLFIIVQFPFSLLCVTLGGVTAEQVLYVYATLACYLFFLCNMSLVWSVVASTTTRAVSFSTSTFFALLMLPGLLYPLLFLGNYSYPPSWVQKTVSSLLEASPFSQTTKLIIGVVEPPGSLWCYGFLLACGLTCFAIAWWLFSRLCKAGAEEPVKRRGHSGGKAGGTLRHPRASHAAVRWKEFRFATGGVKGFLWRIVVCLVIVGLLYWYTEDRRFPGGARAQFIGSMSIFFGLLMFWMELMKGAANAFGAERRDKTLSSLVTLPITVGEIMRQKIAGRVPSLVPYLALSVLGLLVAVSESRLGGGFDSLMLVFFLFLPCEFFLLGALITYLSLRMRRGAAVTGILITFFGNLLLGMVLSAPMRGDGTAGILLMALVAAGVGGFITSRIPPKLEACASEE